MAIISLPDIAFRSVRYRLQAPAQINRSVWTGARQVMGLPGPTRLSLSAEHVPIRGEERMLAWRAFFARLSGPVNTFRMPVTERPQVDAEITAVVAAVPSASSITITVGPADFRTTNRRLLKAGQIITVADQPLILAADLMTGGAGGVTATADFRPLLRRSPAIGAPVVLDRPTALVALDTDVSEWGVDPGQLYSFSIEASEAF